MRFFKILHFSISFLPIADTLILVNRNLVIKVVNNIFTLPHCRCPINFNDLTMYIVPIL